MELFERGVGAEGLRFLRAVGVRHVVAPESGRGQAGALALDGAHARRRGAGASASSRSRRARPHGVVEAGPSGEHPVDARRPRPRVPGAADDRPGRVRALGRRRGSARPSVEASLDGLAWEPVEASASLADATLSLYRDPRHGRGEVRFAPRAARFLRLDPSLPARGGALEVGE